MSKCGIVCCMIFCLDGIIIVGDLYIELTTCIYKIRVSRDSFVFV